MIKEKKFCDCGKRISKYAHCCKKCHATRMNEIYQENKLILEGGKCPDCGRGFRRNMAMFGWWQCEAYGDGCHFQMFTDRGM